MRKRPLFITGAIVLGVILTLIARRSADITPTSDTAVIESFTLLASQGRLLLGPYSRFQWHHPGPIYFFWMAPFYVLSGYRTAGLNAAALALNLASLVLIVRVLSKRASALAALAVSAAISLFCWRAADLLTSPWNPHVTVIGTMALAIVVADVVSRSSAMLPIVAALATLLGQTHVGLLPTAALLGVIAVIAVVVRFRSGRFVARPTYMTMAVLAILWLPPLVEQFTSTDGNLAELWKFFVQEPRNGQPFQESLSAWSDMITGIARPDFAVAQGWRFVESPVTWSEALAVAEILALGVIAASALRARHYFEGSLSAVLALASLLALWSVTRIEGAIFDHEIFWISGLGALNAGAVAGGIGQIVFEKRGRIALSLAWAEAARTALFVGIAALGVTRLIQTTSREVAPSGESRIASAVAKDLQSYLEREGIDRPLIRIDQDTWGIAAGVILRLQKSGRSLAVQDDWLPMFTPVFKETGTEDASLMIAGPAQHVRLSGSDGDSVVIADDPIYVHKTARVNR